MIWKPKLQFGVSHPETEGVSDVSYLTPRQASERLGIARTNICRRIREGTLKALRVDDWFYLIDEKDLEGVVKGKPGRRPRNSSVSGLTTPPAEVEMLPRTPG